MDDKVRVVMVGDRKYRLPFLDLIPFDKKQDEELSDSIKRHKEVQVAIICWKEEKTATHDTVVDGAHRVLHAAAHGLSDIPVKRVSYASEDEAREACIEFNDKRRHSPEGDLEKRRRERSERIERVAEARRQGESLRIIADREKVSLPQVRRDIEVGTVPGEGTVEPKSGKVVGKDGKVRPAKIEKKEPDKKEHVLTDPAGVPVPKKLKDHLGDPWLDDIQKAISEAARMIRERRFASIAEKKGPHFPFFPFKEFCKLFQDVDNALDTLVDLAKDGRPNFVCPKCLGEKCHHCLQSGLVPGWKMDQLKEKK